MLATPSRKLDPYDLMREAMSQAVAEAMIPMRQEINAGIHQLDRRVERLEMDMAEMKATLARIEGKLT